MDRPRTRSARTLLLILLAAASVGACRRTGVERRCEACIERDGSTWCGRAAVDLGKRPGASEGEVKLDAGRAACVELAARKGGGYAGPLFEKARSECEASVRPADLRRATCEDRAFSVPWNPRDGL